MTICRDSGLKQVNTRNRDARVINVALDILAKHPPASVQESAPLASLGDLYGQYVSEYSRVLETEKMTPEKFPAPCKVTTDTIGWYYYVRI